MYKVVSNSRNSANGPYGEKVNQNRDQRGRKTLWKNIGVYGGRQSCIT